MAAVAPASPIQVIELLARSLKTAGIGYCFGGSLASSIHGEFRATNDLDVVCDLNPNNLGRFFKELSTDFILDDVAIQNAVQQQTNFNIFHEPSFFKVDFFIKNDAFQKQQMKRAVAIQIPGGEVTVKIAAPEDVILAKLIWYQLGNLVSDRQWRDILGVIKVQGGRLDQPYLKEWSIKLAVADLLEKALDPKA